MSYTPGQKARMRALAHRLYTETRTPLTKIAPKVGITIKTIRQWANEQGWVRPPKEPAEPRPNITPRQYRERFMAKEFGIAPPSVVSHDVATPRGRPRSDAVKDDFKMTLKASMEDKSAKHRAHLKADRELILKLWDDGLDLGQVATRVRWSKSRIRYALKKMGANMKAPRRMPLRGGGHAYGAGISRNAKAGDWQRRT